MMMSKIIPAYLKFISALFLLLFLFFTLYRIVFVFGFYNHMVPDNSAREVIRIFCFDGMRFDLNTIAFLVLLPFLFLSVSFIINKSSKGFEKITFLLTYILSSFAILLSIIDIAFFGFYNDRINSGLLSWFDDIKNMIITMISYKEFYIILSVVIIFLVLYYKLLMKIFVLSFHRELDRPVTLKNRLVIFVLTGFLLFWGIRGKFRIHERPLNIDDASITQYSFLNLASLNPMGNFIFSFKTPTIKIFEDDQAIKNVRNYLNINQGSGTPVQRECFSEGPENKKNIVIIFMESMSAYQMGAFGNSKKLTPFLDSLAKQSLFFSNFYTSGIHTYNGVFSTLFSLPTIYDIKPQSANTSRSQKYSGISNILKTKGYTNLFFGGVSKFFDNTAGFLLLNDFDHVNGIEDFPKEKVFNGFGLNDYVLFEDALPVLDSVAKSQHPFMAVFLTISSHDGNWIPENSPYKQRSNIMKDEIFRFCDFSMEYFFNSAKKREWFDNTIFVFLADHGQNFEPRYDINLWYHHSPLIIYGKDINPQTFDKMAMQSDVFPTIMSLCNINYTNNTLGINLLKETRPYAYFSDNDRLGCISKDFFLITSKSGKQSLFKYRVNDLKNYADEYPENVNSMKKYSMSMFQVSQWMINNKKTNIQGHK